VAILLVMEPEVQALASPMKTFQLQVLMVRMFTRVALSQWQTVDPTPTAASSSWFTKIHHSHRTIRFGGKSPKV
jgi:hypothetical protein